MNIVSVKHNVE